MKQAYIRPEIGFINLDVESETCLTVSTNEDYLDAGDSFTNQKGSDLSELGWETEDW